MVQQAGFGLALGLAGTPWQVADLRFDREPRRLDWALDFPPGTRFAPPQTGQPASVYDPQPRTWRPLNGFQFEGDVPAFVPRVDGGPDAGVRQVPGPWARAQSGFTRLLAALTVLCAGSA